MKSLDCNSMLLLLLLSLCCIAAVLSAPPVFKPVRELPADIPTCSEDDLNVNECIRSAFQQMIPRMKNGIPELNIPPIDPVLLEKNSYQYSNGVIQGRVYAKNVRINGISDAVVEKVDFRLKDGKMHMNVVTRVPHLFIEGMYKADMKFNEVKMNPKGYFNVTMDNVVMTAYPEGEIYERDGHSYLRLIKFDAQPEVGDMKIYANGLFPDQTLNDVLLEFINQYWRQILTAMLPETRSTWEPLMLNGANAFFEALPFDLILTKQK